MTESTSGDLKYPQSWCSVNKTQWISSGLWPRKIKESPIPGQGVNSLHSHTFPYYAGDSRKKTFKLVIWHARCATPFLGNVSKCLLTPDIKLMKDQNNYTTKLHLDEPVSLRGWRVTHSNVNSSKAVGSLNANTSTGGETHMLSTLQVSQSPCLRSPYRLYNLEEGGNRANLSSLWDFLRLVNCLLLPFYKMRVVTITKKSNEIKIKSLSS